MRIERFTNEREVQKNDMIKHNITRISALTFALGLGTVSGPATTARAADDTGFVNGVMGSVKKGATEAVGGLVSGFSSKGGNTLGTLETDTKNRVEGEVKINGGLFYQGNVIVSSSQIPGNFSVKTENRVNGPVTLTVGFFRQGSVEINGTKANSVSIETKLTINGPVNVVAGVVKHGSFELNGGRAGDVKFRTENTISTGVTVRGGAFKQGNFEG